MFDWSKLKAFADNKLIMVQMEFVSGRKENIAEEEENTGNEQSFSFPTMFSRDFLIRVVKSRDCLV